MSSDAETASATDTPKQSTYNKSLPSQSVLHAHLRETTIEKGRLEETAACLREKAERLKYELADAKQAEVAREDTISILQGQLRRLEDRYASAQEEICTLRQKSNNAEIEVHHLRQLCTTLKEEKGDLRREQSRHPPNRSDENFPSTEELMTRLKILESEKSHEEEKNRYLVRHLEEVMMANQTMLAEKEALIAQNIADVKKLQEDTLCWKERYENCAAKLEMMDKQVDPRLIEAQDTIATLKRTISILQQEKAAQLKLAQELLELSSKDNFSSPEIASAIIPVLQVISKKLNVLLNKEGAGEMSVSLSPPENSTSIEVWHLLRNILADISQGMIEVMKQRESKEPVLFDNQWSFSAADSDRNLSGVSIQLSRLGKQLRNLDEIFTGNFKKFFVRRQSKENEENSMGDFALTGISNTFANPCVDSQSDCEEVLRQVKTLIEGILSSAESLKERLRLSSMIRSQMNADTPTRSRRSLTLCSKESLLFPKNIGFYSSPYMSEEKNSMRSGSKTMSDVEPTNPLISKSSLTSKVLSCPSWRTFLIGFSLSKARYTGRRASSEPALCHGSELARGRQTKNKKPNQRPPPTEKIECKANSDHTHTSEVTHYSITDPSASSTIQVTICSSTHEETDSAKMQAPRGNVAINTIKHVQQELISIRDHLDTPQNSPNEPIESMVVSSDNEPDPIESKAFITFQLMDLQRRLESEVKKRTDFDHHVKNLINELQGKLELETEWEVIQKRLENNFVSKQELDMLLGKHDQAIDRVKEETIQQSENKLSERIEEISKMLQQQVIHEQARLEKERDTYVSMLKQEFEKTHQKLQSELAKVLAALKAKEAEENAMKDKLNQLALEFQKLQDLRRRRSLTEKSDMSTSNDGSRVFKVSRKMRKGHKWIAQIYKSRNPCRDPEVETVEEVISFKKEIRPKLVL